MDKLKMTDTQDCVLFYDSEDVKTDPHRRRILFPMVMPAEDYHQLRFDLKNKDIFLQLWIYIDENERESDEDNNWLCFEAFGKYFLKTEAVTHNRITGYVGREYFYDLYESNNDPNLLAFVGLREA